MPTLTSGVIIIIQKVPSTPSIKMCKISTVVSIKNGIKRGEMMQSTSISNKLRGERKPRINR